MRTREVTHVPGTPGASKRQVIPSSLSLSPASGLCSSSHPSLPSSNGLHCKASCPRPSRPCPLHLFGPELHLLPRQREAFSLVSLRSFWTMSSATPYLPIAPIQSGCSSRLPSLSLHRRHMAWKADLPLGNPFPVAKDRFQLDSSANASSA